METIKAQDVLDYIAERTLVDDSTTWKHLKIRFGYDDTFVKNGKLLRPGTLDSSDLLDY